MKLLVVLLFFARSLNIFVSSCTDVTVNGGQPWKDSCGYGCSSYQYVDKCSLLGHRYEKFGLVANEACCVCGGGITTSPTLSPQPSTSPYPIPSPTSWYRKLNGNDDDPTVTVVIVALLIFVVCSVKGWLKYVKNSSQNSNNNAARSTNLRTRPAQRTPQQTRHAGSSIVDERDIRRQFILTNIIHKKFVTKSSQANDDTEAGTSQDNFQSVEIDEGEVIFPHEAIIRERLERIASMRLGDEEQGGVIATNDKKDDICIETLRSIRSEMNIQLDIEQSLGESLYSPRSCPICCEDYVKGDDVAWSKNEDCCHAFHTDCIVPWLMDHDDCPMCRCVYVKE